METFVGFLIIVVGLIIFAFTYKGDITSNEQEQQPVEPIKPPVIEKPQVKMVISSGASDAPIQRLRYFCVKDKGYHISVWPKDYDQFDVVEFNIAGMSHRENIDKYIGEFVGILEAEPDNPYDSNAIKVHAHDGHHVGYVPAKMTDEVLKVATLPCPCFCYIGSNNGTYFSDCYIIRKI